MEKREENMLNPAEEKRLPLRPCPFCGKSGHTYIKTYPSGDTEPNVMIWHDDDCPLEHIIECFDYYEDEEALAAAWNRRYEEP